MGQWMDGWIKGIWPIILAFQYIFSLLLLGVMNFVISVHSWFKVILEFVFNALIQVHVQIEMD